MEKLQAERIRIAAEIWDLLDLQQRTGPTASRAPELLRKRAEREAELRRWAEAVLVETGGRP